MTRFFFHVNYCGTDILDREGKTLIDNASALQAAIRQSWRIMAEEVAQGRLCLSCHIDIENADTGERTRVRFRDTLRLTDA